MMKHFKDVEVSYKINWKKVGFNVLGSIVIGAVVGGIVDTNPVIALTAGYAGVDAGEGLYKVAVKK